MDLPLGFEDLSNNEVCRLKKPLFGLKQSLKAWFKRFRKLLKKYSFIQSQGDHTLFINHPSLEKITTLIVYEYDIIDTGDDIEKIKSVKHLLAKEFEIKDLGNLRYFLGMEVLISKQGIAISQRKYALDLLKEIERTSCKSTNTPIHKCNGSRYLQTDGGERED